MDVDTQQFPSPPPTALLPRPRPAPSLTPLQAPSPDCGEALQPPLLLREVLAGHQFLRCLERTPLRELWRVAAPDGRLRVAQLLRGVERAIDDRWLDRLLQLTDAALPCLEAVRIRAGQTVLLSDPWERTLLGRFQECRALGLAGVPRPELLDTLTRAAKSLDFFQRHSRVQHLNLHPGNILLQPGQVQLEGFGLAQWFWLPGRAPLRHLHGDYSARELHAGCVSAHCDQYSLALIFAEMLTGVHPVHGGGRRSRVARDQGALRLDALPVADRSILARALDPHPHRRYPNLPALFQALTDATPEPPPLAPLIVLPGGVETSLLAPMSADESLSHCLWVRAGGNPEIKDVDGLRYSVAPGKRLEHQCATRLLPGAALLQLEAFRRCWRGRVLNQSPVEFRCALPLGDAGWRRWFGNAAGMEVHVRMTQLVAGEPVQQVVVQLTPSRCRADEAMRLLAEWGPRVLASVREHLRAEPELRGQERLRWHQPLRVHPVALDQRLSAAIEGVAKDISARGVGLYVPRLPEGNVYVQWPGQPDVSQLAALAHVVRGRQCADGWFEVGAVFE